MSHNDTCSIEWCDRPYVARGWCAGHYNRWKSGRDMDSPFRNQNRYGEGSVSAGGYMQRCENGRRYYEHRRVMEQVIGRELFPDETVHHINGNKLDNRPENLELWSKSHPAGQRVIDKVDWAVMMLRRYRPELLLESTLWSQID